MIRHLRNTTLIDVSNGNECYPRQMQRSTSYFSDPFEVRRAEGIVNNVVKDALKFVCG
jgi:hypothetical protein